MRSLHHFDIKLTYINIVFIGIFYWCKPTWSTHSNLYQKPIHSNMSLPLDVIIGDSRMSG